MIAPRYKASHVRSQKYSEYSQGNTQKTMEHILFVILLFLSGQCSGKNASSFLITLENNSIVLADSENGNEIEG